METKEGTATTKHQRYLFMFALSGQPGRVVVVSDSQSSAPGFEFRADDQPEWFLGPPEFKSIAVLVNASWFLIVLCLLQITCNLFAQLTALPLWIKR